MEPPSIDPGDRRPLRQDNAARPRDLLGEDLVMGLRFFSRLPTGDRPHKLPDLDRIAFALPFTSFAIGFLPALLLMGACWLGMPALYAAVLGVGAMIIATGAMSEDALADSADGLFGGATPERRLDIMKDSRHGTYGVCAIGIYLALRITGIGALAAVNPLAGGGVLLATSILGRSASLWLSVDLYPAREGGASASVGRVRKRSFGIGIGFALLLFFVLAGPFVGLVGLLSGLIAATGVVFGWALLCRQLVGGQTGDLIGALQALVEVTLLTVFMIFART